MKVLLSICIPSYNRPTQLKRLVAQLLLLKSQDLEFVFCDDCSTDKSTITYLEDLRKRDDRVAVYFNKSNLGITGNYFQTLGYANGKYVMLLSNEDSIPEDFEKIIFPMLYQKYNAILGILKFECNDKHNYLINNPQKDIAEINTIFLEYQHFIFRAHISGNIYNKNSIDFQILNEISDIKDNYYPIVPLTLMAVNKGNILLTKNSFVKVGLSQPEYEKQAKSSFKRKKEYSRSLSIKKQLELYNLYINIIVDSEKIESFRKALAASFIYYLFKRKKVGISQYKNVITMVCDPYIGGAFRNKLFSNFVSLHLLFAKALIRKYTS